MTGAPATTWTTARTRLASLTPFTPGLPPVTLIVVIVGWALFAVLMLTGTVTAANQIDDRVRVINTVYPEIDHNLKAVRLAATTGQIAGHIRDAAVPLSPQFTQIVQDVAGINTSVTSILGGARSINASVVSINQRVHAIHGSVLPIAAGLSSVDDKVVSIHSSVHQINDRFGRVREHVDSIDDRLVHGSNDRIQAVIDHAEGVRDDTDRLAEDLVPDILKNSHAISRSPILDPTDTSRLDSRRLDPLLTGLTHPGQLPSLLGLVHAAGKPALPVPLPGPLSPGGGQPITTPLDKALAPLGVLGGPLTGRHNSTSRTHPDSSSPLADTHTPVLPLAGLLGSG